MKNKKMVLGIIVVLLLGIIIFIVGRSFGFFKYVKEGTIINTIKINGIEVKVLNPEDNALDLNSAYPMNDDDGLNLTPFQFEVKNTTSRDLTYEIKIVSDTEKLADCTLEDQSPCQALSTDNIKFAYKEEDDQDYTEPAVLTNNIVASVTIPAKETLTHSILLWIKDDVDNEVSGKYFYGKIILEGTAAESTD